MQDKATILKSLRGFQSKLTNNQTFFEQQFKTLVLKHESF